MSVNYIASLKTTRMNDVVAAIGSLGVLEIQDSSGSVLASIALSNPAGFVVGSVLTFNGLPLTDSSANASGTASKAVVKNGAGDVIISGLTVSSSSGDIILSTTAVVASLPVALASATITHG